MERKFYTDNFEKLLREHADQFKMTPSKKVWHGIYNNMHPGRRWPSIAMTLVFLFTLVIVGHLNTNNGYKNAAEFASVNDTKQKSDAQVSKSNHTTRHRQNSSNATGAIKPAEPSSEIIADNTIADALLTNSNPLAPLADNTNKISKDIPVANNDVQNNKEHYSVLKNGNKKNKIGDNTNEKLEGNSEDVVVLPATNFTSEIKTDEISSEDKNSENKNNNTATSLKQKTNNSEQSQSATALLKIKKNKMTWMYYITPGISYRSITYHEVVTSNSSALSLAAPANQSSYLGGSAINKPTISFEAGGVINYPLTKKLQFTGGLQINYSGYNIKAVTTHPTIAALLLNSENIDRPYVVSATSFYGNGTGPSEITLHNYSLQASVPFGLQYNLTGNDNVQLNLAATFQPLYVISSKAYLLSTDKRNYLTEPSLSRKWNMSTDFGTYVSFKSNTFNWQIGPQIHYQILSTYSANFPGKEHLIDYGIRFGISKLSK